MKKAKYFGATWCGPCQTFKPIMKEIASDGYNVEFIENEQEALSYGVRGVPTTIILEDNRELGRFVGPQPKNSIIERLK
jgi:thioredoxin 1